MTGSGDEKWALITGASTGIGQATCQWLATRLSSSKSLRGWNLLAGVRREEDAKKLESLSPQSVQFY